MLWEVEILPRLHDPETERVRQELDLLTHGQSNDSAIDLASRGYLLEGDFPQDQAERLLNELLLDPLAEAGRAGPLNTFADYGPELKSAATVLLKPGVMDPVAESVLLAARD